MSLVMQLNIVLAGLKWHVPDQGLYIFIDRPGSRQVAILAVYVGTTVA